MNTLSKRKHTLLLEFDLHPSQTATFVGLRGLLVRFVSGKDVSNGYTMLLSLVTHFADSGYNKREQYEQGIAIFMKYT